MCVFLKMVFVYEKQTTHNTQHHIGLVCSHSHTHTHTNKHVQTQTHLNKICFALGLSLIPIMFGVKNQVVGCCVHMCVCECECPHLCLLYCRAIELLALNFGLALAMLLCFATCYIRCSRVININVFSRCTKCVRREQHIHVYVREYEWTCANGFFYPLSVCPLLGSTPISYTYTTCDVCMCAIAVGTTTSSDNRDTTRSTVTKQQQQASSHSLEFSLNCLSDYR